MKPSSYFLTACLMGGLALGAPAVAQDWPEKTVRVVVPYGAGSTPDTLARLLFDRVQKNTGKTMVIENRAGAGGMIGTALVAKSPADGHTLVLAPSGPLGSNVLLYRKMPYDPIKDLTPVAMVGETPTILVTSTQVKAANARELLEEMARPDSKMTYASPGNGTLGHLNMAYLVSRSGATVPHAAYPGAPQIITGLIAGDVQIAALPPLVVSNFVRSGKIRALATIGPRRSASLPDVPTLKEQGVDFAPVGWFAIAVAASTPVREVEQMHKTLTRALEDEEVRKALSSQGMDAVSFTPRELQDYVRRDVEQWRPVIERNQIVLD